MPTQPEVHHSLVSLQVCIAQWGAGEFGQVLLMHIFVKPKKQTVTSSDENTENVVLSHFRKDGKKNIYLQSKLKCSSDVLKWQYVREASMMTRVRYAWSEKGWVIRQHGRQKAGIESLSRIPTVAFTIGKVKKTHCVPCHRVFEAPTCVMDSVQRYQGQSPLVFVNGFWQRPQVPQHANTIILTRPSTNTLPFLYTRKATPYALGMCACVVLTLDDCSRLRRKTHIHIIQFSVCLFISFHCKNTLEP